MNDLKTDQVDFQETKISGHKPESAREKLKETQSNDQLILYFGDIVSIRSSEHGPFYIYGDGFASNNVSIHNINVDPPLFSHRLFVVLPNFSSRVKNSTGEYLDRLTSNTPSPHQIYNDIELKLDDIMSEYLNNIDYIDKMRLVKIKYNTPIQLLHLSSKKFLSIPASCNINSQANSINLELNELPSQNTIFKFFNVFKYQGMGTGNVFYQDEVKLCYSVAVDEVYAGLNFDF